MKRLLMAHYHDPDTGEVEAEPVTVEEVGNAVRLELHDGTLIDFDREQFWPAEKREAA